MLNKWKKRLCNIEKGRNNFGFKKILFGNKVVFLFYFKFMSGTMFYLFKKKLKTLYFFKSNGGRMEIFCITSRGKHFIVFISIQLIKITSFLSNLRNFQVVPIEKNCFSEIYKWLKLNLTEKMRKDLSSPLAFAALLHLCNECDLELVQQPDLKDVQIKSINVKGG